MIGHSARVNGLAFSPDGSSFFSCGDDRSILHWSLKGIQIAHYQGHKNYVNSIAISEDGQHLYSASEDGTAKKWRSNAKVLSNFPHFTEASSSPGYSLGIGAAALSPDASLLATAGYKAYVDPVEEAFDEDDKSQLIRIWDLKEGSSKALSGHADGIMSVAFSPDSKQLISGSKDGTARLWNLDSGDAGSILSRQKGEVSAVAFAARGSFFLTAGADSLCRIWSDKGDSIGRVKHGDWITAVAIAANGKQFATAGMDQKIMIWKGIKDPSVSRILEGHSASVIALAYSPDGKYLASGGEDNVLNVWDQSGRLVFSKQELGKNLSGIGAIRSLAFSKDSKYLLAGEEDGSVKLFDLQGNILQSMQVSPAGISSVSFDAEGKNILTAGDDGVARLSFRINDFLNSGRLAKPNEPAP